MHFKGLKTGASLCLKQSRHCFLSGFGGQYQQKTSKELQQELLGKIHLEKFAPPPLFFSFFFFVSDSTPKLLKQTTVRLEPRQSLLKVQRVSECAPSYHLLPLHRLVLNGIEKGCEGEKKRIKAAL